MKISASLWQRLLPLFLFAFMLNTSASMANTSFPLAYNDSYVSEISGDGLYTWNKGNVPIKVYMQSGSGLPGYKEIYPEILSSCFDEWVKVSDGKLSWQKVHNKKDADIVVSWSNEAVEASRGTEAGNTKTFAFYNTQTNWGRINRAEMRLLTRLPEREFTEAEVRKAYLHEVGHAFGIAGHSSNKNDIMYFAISNQQEAQLTNRDKATINFLYEHDAKSTMISSAQNSKHHKHGHTSELDKLASQQPVDGTVQGN